mgnify:CR=1 FL=1
MWIVFCALTKPINDKIIDVGKYHSNNEYIAKLIFNSLNIGEVNFQYSDDENRAIRLCKGQVDASLVYGAIANNLVKKTSIEFYKHKSINCSLKSKKLFVCLYFKTYILL